MTWPRAVKQPSAINRHLTLLICALLSGCHNISRQGSCESAQNEFRDLTVALAPVDLHRVKPHSLLLVEMYGGADCTHNYVGRVYSHNESSLTLHDADEFLSCMPTQSQLARLLWGSEVTGQWRSETVHIDINQIESIEVHGSFVEPIR